MRKKWSNERNELIATVKEEVIYIKYEVICKALLVKITLELCSGLTAIVL